MTAARRLFRANRLGAGSPKSRVSPLDCQIVDTRHSVLSRSQVLSRGEQQRLAILRLFWRHSLIQPGILQHGVLLPSDLLDRVLRPVMQGCGFASGPELLARTSQAFSSCRAEPVMHLCLKSDGHNLAKLQLHAIQWTFFKLVTCSKPATATVAFFFFFDTNLYTCP